MGVRWTEEQRKVIGLRGRNILVSAAAGSGKTAVLVERIIGMLTEDTPPASVERLLIVTFTEAAAAEMKDRIRAAIERKLSEQPDNEHLRQQATLINNAQITTIHSFCLSVIRDHFHRIDLDPGFRIGEEGELKLLRQDVLGEMLEERYASGEERFSDFVSAYGTGRDDRKIEELILKIYDFSRSYPDADGWLSRCADAYRAGTEEELEKRGYVKLIKENVRRYLEDARELLSQALAVCREPDGPLAYETALQNDMRMTEELLSADTFAELSERMRAVSWSRLAANRDKTVSEEKTACVKAIREEVKGLIREAASQYFSQDAEGTLEDLRLCEPQIEMLTELVREFAGRFEEKKREKEMIDFSDMEQYALRILTRREGEDFVPSEAAKEYQRQFLEIMIDEYQDSNLIQEAILTSISTVSEGRNNIFMVGDVKQSIYRFRLSRPELFMEKFDSYGTGDGPEQRIDLHKNFRSRREVLDSVNYLFRRLMIRELGGVAYDDRAALYAGAEYPEAEGQYHTEVLVIDSGAEDAEEDVARGEDGAPGQGGAVRERGGQPVSPRELEARAVAGRIRELMRSLSVTDKETGELRPVRYGDIVILTRSAQGFADVFAEVLTREGIPAFAGTREGYFAAQEIGALLDYLRVLNNMQQDIPLAAVLASPFGGFTESELAVIRSEYKGIPFHRAVCLYREQGEDKAVREKLARCLEQMDRFREIVPYTPIHELLRRILADTGYGDFVSAMPGGEQRRANIEMLAERAKAFEATSYKGLFHFVRYIEELRRYDVDYGEASLEDERADTVRIMTIHKSKGLEFPVVFVAGMGKRFNMQDARSSVTLHARLGIGLDAVDLERRTKSPSLIKRVIRKEEALDSLGEELRVLYVALTRAKEKLIITGTLADPQRKFEELTAAAGRSGGHLSFGRLSRAVTYWDWLLPALAGLTPDVPIELRMIAAADIVRAEAAEEMTGRLKRSVLEHWDTDRIYEPEIRGILEEQFGYRYPYEETRGQKLKFTVSELKKRISLSESMEDAEEMGELPYEEPDVVPLIPKFLQETEELSGASRGTAYHRVMELIGLARTSYSEEDVRASIGQFLKEGRLTEEMAACVRPADILGFLESPAGLRMRESARRGGVRREQPFVIGLDAREIYPGEAEGEQLLVQGIIDAYFEEPDGLVVLDYKTDRVRAADELTEKYHAQLDYYAKALEQLTGKRVKEKIIYSFTLGEEISIPCCGKDGAQI